MLRTQIYLPEDLRKEIERYRAQTGESLSKYLRKAAEEKVAKDKERKAELRRLAEEFIGSSKRSDKEIQEWVDMVREERRLADEVREERLQRAFNRK